MAATLSRTLHRRPIACSSTPSSLASTATRPSLPAFVRIVPTSGGQDGLLQVDADGPGGGAGWQDLAVVQGQPNLHTQALYQVGDLVIDDHAPAKPFDPLAYIASYDDLIRAIGTDAQTGKLHYLTQGFDEQRVSTFDGLQYIATHGDLIDALGPDRNAGATHFINNGLDELRLRDGFDEVQYIANYKDLQDAFGTDYEAATRHYITNGYHEERTDKPLGDSPPLVASDEAAAGAAQGDFLLESGVSSKVTANTCFPYTGPAPFRSPP